MYYHFLRGDNVPHLSETETETTILHFSHVFSRTLQALQLHRTFGCCHDNVCLSGDPGVCDARVL